MRSRLVWRWALAVLSVDLLWGQSAPPSAPGAAPPSIPPSAQSSMPALPDPPLVSPAWVTEATARATAVAFPDADTVVVADATRIAYQPDGTSLEINEEYTKVLTEKGKRESRTRSYQFATHYERVHILAAEVIKPDGTRAPVDVAAQVREMVEPSQMGSNIYDPNRKVVQLAMPGLEIGDIARLVVVQVTSKARVPDTWSDYAVFEHTSPILSLSYEIHAPAARPLLTIRLRDELPDTVAYTESRTEGGTIHRWSVRDVPQAFPEPNMPPMHTVVQRLLVSTITDWRDISRWYWNLCASPLGATSDAMRDEVDKLLANATTRDERVRRLFGFVSQQIRYMGVTPEEEAPGYEPHDVRMTFDNRYGVCRDKAALLVAMLRMADIPAYPVLVQVGPRKDAEVPQPFFNHAIVAVEREEGGVGAARYLLMDPTDEKTRDLLPGYLRNKSFLVAHPEGETLLDSGPAPAEDNLVRITSSGRLDANDALILDTTIHFEGVNDNAYRNHFARLKPEERRLFFEGLVRGRIAGASLGEFMLAPADLADTSVPLKATLRYVAPEFPVAGDGAWVVGIPWLGSSIGYANWVIGRTGLVRRRFPLDTDPTCGIEETVEIDVGKRFGKPRAMPGELVRSSDGLLFEQRVTLDEGGVLRGSARFHVRAAEFSPEAYLALREDLKEMEFAARRRPIFDPPSTADEADVRVLSEETRVELLSADAWTTVRKTRLKVLTYAGQKARSELILGYNPAWQTVELLSADVTAPDGTVRKVGPHETNTMDAPWVGGAPRYPAEKTLVVSLPGVEVGSVISTVVKTTQRNAPFFNYRTSFQGSEPVDLATLELAHPLDRKVKIVQPVSSLAVPVKYERSEKDGRVTHRWTVKDTPALRSEDDVPPGWTYLPTLLVSTGDWVAYGAALRLRFAELAGDQPAARAKAVDVVKETTSEEARVSAIRDFVARAIRVQGPDFTALPLDSLSSADQTLKDGYGHRADTAILLLAMLDAAGLKAEPLLVGGGAPVLSSLVSPLWVCPQRPLFNTVLVRVQTAGGAILLNDTDNYAELGTTQHEDRPSMTLDGVYDHVAVTDDRRTQDDDEWRLEVSADGSAKIEFERRYWGTAVNGFRKLFSEMPPEERRRYHQELVAAVSQAASADGDLHTDLTSYPGVRRLSVAVPRYGVREGRTLHLTLPGIDENLLRLRAERRWAPLYRASFSEAKILHRVRFPATVRRVLIAPPAGLEIDLPGKLGFVAVTTESRRLADGRLEVTVQRRVSFDSAVASSELYPALLAVNRRLQHASYRTLVVEIE